MSRQIEYAPKVKVFGAGDLHICTVPGARAKEYIHHKLAEPLGKGRLVRAITLISKFADDDQGEPARNSTASKRSTYPDPVPSNPNLISMKFVDSETGLLRRQR